MAAMAAAVAVGLVAQMCAVLLAGPRAAAAAVVRAPGAALQRLTEAEWGSYHEVDHQGPGTYVFGYDVDDPETGNTQFRQEERYPNGTVAGSYGLVLPDGSVQVVHYTADHLGYRARIETKKPETRFRAATVAPRPTYAAVPQPSAYAAVPRPPAYAAPPPPQPPPPPARTLLPPLTPGEYEPVFWLPPPAAAPPFSANYV